jgi:hypothetical protein
MPTLTSEDFAEAVALGKYIGMIMEGDGGPVKREIIDDIRQQLEIHSGNLVGILRSNQLFPTEEMANFIFMISEKSDSSIDEWKDIADLLYYEYMQGAAAPEVVAELYPRSTR